MNKYKLNYIQFLTGLPRNIAKTVRNLRWKDNETITYTAKFPIKLTDWRMGVGSCK